MIGFARKAAFVIIAGCIIIPAYAVSRNKTDDSWADTLSAARAQLDRKIKNGSIPVFSLEQWYCTGPIQGVQFNDCFGAEEILTVDPADPDIFNAWQPRDWHDGTVIHLPSVNQASTYVGHRIISSGSGPVTLELGSDDGIIVWMNGEKVHENNIARGVQPASDTVSVAIQPGTNILVMKIVNGGGAHGFWFSCKNGDVEEIQQTFKQKNPDEYNRLPQFIARYCNETLSCADLTGILREDCNALIDKEPFIIRLNKLAVECTNSFDPAWLQLTYDCAVAYDSEKRTLASACAIDFPAVRRSVSQLSSRYPEHYPHGDEYLKQLSVYEPAVTNLLNPIKSRGVVSGITPKDIALLKEVTAFTRRILLENPLLDFDRILLVKRQFPGAVAKTVIGAELGTPTLNSYTNDNIPHPRNNWDNVIAVLSNLHGTPELKTIFRPEKDVILRDLEVEFDAERIMFSSIAANGRWAVFEMNKDGSGLKKLTPDGMDDIDFFDSCYLPDGRIITCATAGYQGLPCVNGGEPMVNLYLLDPDSGAIRQLTFEQDSDFHPAVMDNGRVLYLRWEYSDIMHYYSRILFHCNPDGSNQSEYYGSGSMFPTAFKHARQIPGTPKVVGIVGGHHSIPESGRLCVVDPRLSRKYPFRYRPKTKEWGPPGSYINAVPDILPAEKTGFVNEIPGYGKPVVGNVLDGQSDPLFGEGKPHFVYPYPLSEEYFLVSMKRDQNALWGIYLVDIFDNMTLICEQEGTALLEPIPLRATPRPPIIVDRIVPEIKTANVFITDIYTGPGLKDIPRGTVKALRVFSYHYCYNFSGGHDSVGTESSWDVKRILGTVPVNEDGSTSFVIPANTPVSLQPLDEEDRALQLMRSWFVGMPGENVSCVGCHERQNMVTQSKPTSAAFQTPEPITPWFGPPRPFAFEFEVQPLLDRYCVECHNGTSRPDGKTIPDFVMRRKGPKESNSYNALHPYVRRPGPESDMDILSPMEYFADTSELVKMLRTGHHNVRLDREAWERLYTWIDLNAPYRGAWKPGDWRGCNQVQRRLELAKLFAGIDCNPEEEYDLLVAGNANRRIEPVMPAPLPEHKNQVPAVPGFPFDAVAAIEMQKAIKPVKLPLCLGNGYTVTMVRIPAGTFVMGSDTGYADELPRAIVTIDKPFWMSETEISNGQYEQYDAEHDTRYIDEHGKDQAVPGYIANHVDQPVARVSWRESMAFCRWLSGKTCQHVTLPTEAQWEWAARAGTGSQFYYGDGDTDFSPYANLSDHSTLYRQTGWDGGSMIHVRRKYAENGPFPLRENRFDDGCMVVNYVGQYQPNAWGLKDTAGNVCEWTRSSYKPYPYNDIDGRNNGNPDSMKVARGGSWNDRPKSAGASVRFACQPYQKVYNVGFRIIVEETTPVKQLVNQQQQGQK